MDPEISSIFIIDSGKENILLYRELLVHSFEMTLSNALQEALEILSRKKFPIILLNLNLQDSRGLPTFEKIYAAAPHAAIIVVSESSNTELAFKVLKSGAEDFLLIGDLDRESLEKAIFYSIARQSLKEGLKSQTFTDELTSLYNRRGFMQVAEQHLNYAKRHEQGFNFFLMDLNHLKNINDTYGHLAGDLAIISAALTLQKSFRSSDIIGRIGGDEYAAIALDTREGAGPIIKEALEDAIEEFNLHRKHPFEVSFSIGYAYFNPKEKDSIQSLLEKADKMLYENKHLQRVRRP